MNKHMKKLLILNIPYVFIGLFVTKISQAWRYTSGVDLGTKILNFDMGFARAFENYLPSFHPQDLLVGLVCAGLLRLFVYVRSKNAKKFRHGREYGSARWGNQKDIAPFTDPTFQNNVILTQTESLTMNNRPKDPKTARNKNVLIIGGSGSGKTRFWLKPNLMQCHSSVVVTDPKGGIVVECGKMLQREGYKIKILNNVH